MPPIFVGIAGGTGSGKSTLCTALQNKHPVAVGLIQLDDYFKPEAEVPKLEGMTNWDHPNALSLAKLARDLFELAEGNPVVINTKNELLNPAYKRTKKRIPVEFRPKPVMLVEGFLVLWDERIRRFFATAIWLDIDHDVRWARRVHFKYPEYEEKVLIPMHQRYVEPTKQYATHVIDIANKSKEEILAEVENIISRHFDFQSVV